MIGTRIRGFRHLIRMAKASQKEIGFFFKHDSLCVGYGVAMYDEQGGKGDKLLIFNDIFSNSKPSELGYVSENNRGRAIELNKIYPHLWIMSVNRSRFNEENQFFNSKIVVPDDFEKKYREFCEANKKQLPNATKYSSVDSSFLKYIFLISNGSKNFFFWAVNAYFKQQTSLYLIERILLWNEKYSQLSKNLKKGTITAYTNGKDFFDVVREMSKLRRDKRANDVINMFNTTQKKLLRGITLDNRDYETLSKFAKLSPKKKINFIRKMSTVEDPREILRQMSFLADVHFVWKKESLLDFLKNGENFNCEIVINKGDIVLLKVNDYETVKRLAKTTNWCISKDKKYWNEYVENNSNSTQYVLMDFSRKEDDNLSIVGFTSVHDKGITNAHDFQNKNLMQGRRTSIVSEIKSFVSNHVDCSNIFSVLDKNGINLSDVVTYAPSQYEWNRENMFDYLNQCISDDFYYIVHDDGNKVAIIAENDDVRYFLGDAYMGQIGHNDRGYGNSEYIIFADFTKKQNDPEKLVFGEIVHNYDTHESSCGRLYNERFEAIGQSFDSKLNEYGLPYDIICRTENPVDRFYSSLYSLELASAKDLIKDKKVIDSLLKTERVALVNDCLTNVTFGYNSSDYIDLFYDNGFKLSSIIGARSAGNIARRIINNLFDGYVHIGLKVPSAKEIEMFKAGSIDDYNRSFYIGSFLMLMKMMENESDIDFLYRIANDVYGKHHVCDLFDLVMTIICEKTNFSVIHDIVKYIVSYGYNYGSHRVVNAINNQKNICNSVKKYIDSCKRIEVKTTEMWVKQENGIYTISGVDEEVASHSPRRV